MTAYKGEKQWAPCFHGDESEFETSEYVNSVLAKGRPPDDTYVQDKGVAGIEDMLWSLGLGWYQGELSEDIVDIKFGFYADQWVGVSAEVHHQDGKIINLWTEGDTFTLALAKTLDRLKEQGYWTATAPKQNPAE